MSDSVDYQKEYNKLYDQLEEFQSYLTSPSEYRKVYREDSNEDIFDLLKKEIVDYAKSNSDFKKYLLDELEEPKAAEPKSYQRRIPGAANQSFTSRLRSPMIYTPRSSSRPYVD